MDQQLIVFYLSRKRLSVVAVHDDFVATLGAEAVSYPSVARYLREATFDSSNPPGYCLRLNISSMILIRLSSSRSPISPSHQFASYHDSYTYQERLFTND
jgi:hypothetical protein